MNKFIKHHLRIGAETNYRSITKQNCVFAIAPDLDQIAIAGRRANGPLRNKKIGARTGD
jgi:hypothetical protein